MNYLQLLWAGLLGWLVFGHVPDPVSILGMCVVAASGVMIAFKSRPPTFRISSTVFVPAFIASQADAYDQAPDDK
jgi:drug/metabolite transporter (DMT)-like permease